MSKVNISLKWVRGLWQIIEYKLNTKSEKTFELILLSVILKEHISKSSCLKSPKPQLKEKVVVFSEEERKN